MTITKARELVDSKSVSPTELVKEYLRSASKHNAELNAYIRLTEESALAEAERSTERIMRGEKASPLEGIPYALKDNISTSGIATTCASRMLENYVPFYNAFVYDVLGKSGAVMLGKANMDEFAMGSTNETSYFGPVRNPHNTDHAAGGSSGGAAAAVASGSAVFAIGSDTGGSIREPAAFCGAVGLKPTYGAVSRRGLIAYASSLDQIGPITQCVTDAALIFDAISKRDERDMTSCGADPVSGMITGDVSGMKIGIAHEFFDDLPDEITSPVMKAVSVLESKGAAVTRVSFPRLYDALPAYYIIACAEASSNLGRYDGIRYGYRPQERAGKPVSLEETICRTRSEGFGEEVKRRILLGTFVLSAGYYEAYYGKAKLLQRIVSCDFAELFSKLDVLITPTAPFTAPKLGAAHTSTELFQADICTVPVNIAGLPAVSIPVGNTASGLPVGAQIIGPKFGEGIILNAAYAIEREVGYNNEI